MASSPEMLTLETATHAIERLAARLCRVHQDNQAMLAAYLEEIRVLYRAGSFPPDSGRGRAVCQQAEEILEATLPVEDTLNNLGGLLEAGAFNTVFAELEAAHLLLDRLLQRYPVLALQESPDLFQYR